MKRGVIYLVSGGRSYLGELMTSLRSLRQHEPTLPVTIFSKFRIPSPLPFCRSVHPRKDGHPLQLKVLTLNESPYEETLFLDTDTTILGPLGAVFEHLKNHDFAAANSHEADWSVQPPRFVALVKPGDYNTGVLLYRKSAGMLAFLSEWESAVLAQDPSDMWAGHNCDQFYFNKLVSAGALVRNGVNFLELDNVMWNARGAMLPRISGINRMGDVRILHHRTKSMKLRKLLYSVTDWNTVREIALKGVQRLKG